MSAVQPDPAQVSKERRELAALRRENADLKARSNRSPTSKDLRSSRDQERLQFELDEVSEKCSRAVAEARDLSDRLTRAEGDSAMETTQLRRRIAEYEAEVAKFQYTRNEAESFSREKDDYLRQIEKLTSQIRKLKTEIRRLADQNERLAESATEAERQQQSELAVQAREIDRLKNEVRKAKQNGDQYQSRLESLRTETEKLQACSGELEALQEQFLRVRRLLLDQTDELEAENKELKQRLGIRA
jgi:chromosome segregation ATPase